VAKRSGRCSRATAADSAPNPARWEVTIAGAVIEAGALAHALPRRRDDEGGRFRRGRSDANCGAGVNKRPPILGPVTLPFDTGRRRAGYRGWAGAVRASSLKRFVGWSTGQMRENPRRRSADGVDWSRHLPQGRVRRRTACWIARRAGTFGGRCFSGAEGYDQVARVEPCRRIGGHGVSRYSDDHSCAIDQATPMSRAKRRFTDVGRGGVHNPADGLRRWRNRAGTATRLRELLAGPVEDDDAVWVEGA